jgi:hypothetical protein
MSMGSGCSDAASGSGSWSAGCGGGSGGITGGLREAMGGVSRDVDGGRPQWVKCVAVCQRMG